MKAAFPSSHIDSRLRFELRKLAQRMQARHLNRRSALAWVICAAISAALLGLAWIVSAPPLALVAALMGVLVVCGWRVSRWWSAPVTNYADAAALLEKRHPELRQSLRTALEQRPDSHGRYTFLQTHVLNEALDHAARHFWSRTPLTGERAAAAWHGAALIGACIVLFFSAQFVPSLARQNAATSAARASGKIEIVPGNAEVERGSTVVFTARFGGKLPRTATLQWRGADGSPHSAPMARSLSDPVFATTLPSLERDIDYSVVYDDSASPDYRITVYDLPKMVRGDAVLDFPDFTGLESKTIEDTRRVSAVEGTQLDYSILTNKPVRNAHLRAPDGTEIALEATNPERSRFAARMPIVANARYTIRLADDAGRDNTPPPELRIEALPNRRPDLKVAFPRGDQRVSAIEEVALEASAADDFGLLDYGIAWSIGGAEPQYLSRTKPVDAASAAPRQASFQHLLALEEHDARANQLVAWFAWADDMGSDGEPRRTTGDLFFAEVRPFDEIFRESEGGNQQGDAGSAAGDAASDLLELQREITLAIWKLRDQPAGTDGFHEDVTTVLESQRTARTRLERLSGQLPDARMRTAAEEAGRQMDQAEKRLDESREQSATGPLTPAWASAQGAYQSLLRMQPNTTEVGQQRNARGGQGRGQANQRQLDQLRFKNNEDRYETESQAQVETTPEQREQMQSLARLRELARRQSDMNERLQQLQTALEAAQDEAERERIRRELKRLEEEQRRMLADLDELRQRMDRQSPGADTAQAREQVERTREEMRRAGEALEEGAVSRALASGTRAQEGLEEARDNLRRESSSEFAEEMRDLRRAARELAESQRQIGDQIGESQRETAPSLDNSGKREELARAMEQNRETLSQLNEQLRRVTEESEEAEPGLHRQLYDLLREQGQGGAADDRMEAAAELMRRGFTDQAGEMLPEITESLDKLARGVERAAESVLGDEASTMRFAQNELDDLTRELGSGSEGDEREGPQEEGELSRQGSSNGTNREDEQSGSRTELAGQTDQSSQPGQRDESSSPDEPGESGRRGRTEATSAGRSNEGGSSPQGGGADELARALSEFAEGGPGDRRGSDSGGGGWWDDRNSPITEGDFGAWEERLRTVESLLEEPEARERLAGARELAASLRRDYRRHGKPPQWATVESGIVAPLSEVRGWLRQELARREDPAALQPVDRDPVPDGYAEAVQRYYEALGE